MTERIKTALSALGISTWLINEKTVESFELFTVRHAEDMRRAKNVTEASVTVYRDHDAYRGHASVIVTPDMDDSEINAKLSSAWESAQYVNNPFFELPEPALASEPHTFAPLDETAALMKEALYANDTDDTSFINSSEIFAEHTHTLTLTSRGTRVSYDALRVQGEFVVQCVSPEDVELYFSFDYPECDTASLSVLSKEALKTVSDRARAVSAPDAGRYDILLTGKNLQRLLEMYPEKADAAMVYPHYSDYKPGMNVQGDNIKGEKLNIDMFENPPFSNDGIPMPPRPLIKDGVLVNLHGNTRFCRYIGIEPSGSYSCIKVNNGTLPLSEMQKDGVLMPVAFSDIEVDALRGTFAGEIRLAYLFENGEKRLLTGGSINGSLTEKQSEILFSLERYESASYSGPYAILLRNVSVAGK